MYEATLTLSLVQHSFHAHEMSCGEWWFHNVYWTYSRHMRQKASGHVVYAGIFTLYTYVLWLRYVCTYISCNSLWCFVMAVVNVLCDFSFKSHYRIIFECKCICMTPGALDHWFACSTQQEAPWQCYVGVVADGACLKLSHHSVWGREHWSCPDLCVDTTE